MSSRLMSPTKSSAAKVLKKERSKDDKDSPSKPKGTRRSSLGPKGPDAGSAQSSSSSVSTSTVPRSKEKASKPRPDTAPAKRSLSLQSGGHSSGSVGDSSGSKISTSGSGGGSSDTALVRPQTAARSVSPAARTRSSSTVEDTNDKSELKSPSSPHEMKKNSALRAHILSAKKHGKRFGSLGPSSSLGSRRFASQSLPRNHGAMPAVGSYSLRDHVEDDEAKRMARKRQEIYAINKLKAANNEAKFHMFMAELAKPSGQPKLQEKEKDDDSGDESGDSVW